MNKKEIQEKLNNLPKPKYLYQRYNGEIRKYEIQDNILINVKNVNDIIDKNKQLILGETSENIIDLIEIEDYVNGIEVVNIYESRKRSFLGYLDEKTLELKNDIYETIPTEYLICNKDIKSVLTKEQFHKYKYEV